MAVSTDNSGMYNEFSVITGLKNNNPNIPTVHAMLSTMNSTEFLLSHPTTMSTKGSGAVVVVVVALLLLLYPRGDGSVVFFFNK